MKSNIIEIEMDKLLKELIKENEKLKECVEFYSKKDIYEFLSSEKMIMGIKDECIKTDDFGGKARQTLEQLKG